MDHPVARSRDERLAALHRYNALGAPREPPFDEIVAVAARLCDTPMAAINFIDDRQSWTKAAFGVETLIMPADISICARAVRQNGVFVVGDIAKDARFDAFAAAIVGPRPRFYAGAPITTADGHAIGALCVLDVRARDINEDQKIILRTLARHAMTELELSGARQEAGAARLEVERLLVEKEALRARNDVLMREVDHRVKNSLQVVASMLHFQARRMPDDDAAQALEEAQRRIGGIAAVHEQLYQASNSDQVNLRDFLEGICASLATSRPDNVTRVVVEAAPVIVDSKRAMKIGLLVSELVTNAFRHAYKDDRRGDIRVSLAAKDAAFQLAVSDDGAGLPDGFRAEASKGLGMRLIRSVLDQFRGTMTVNQGPGARFIIDMPTVSS